ncbi:MAG: RNA 2',3'-cyclic phosphodiesterase [Bacteroidota bacterium]|nr:RNA 2',3'-cyclic phosphodiesterase [Bacteroidota bacterium]
MRLFIGIDLPPKIKVKLKHFQHKLKATGTNGSWKSKETFHITLEFLGELQEESVPILSEILKQVASDKNKFRLMIEGLNAFPNIKRAHTLWADVKGDTDILHQIRHEIHSALIEKGFQVQSSSFVPHITLLSRPRLAEQLPLLKKSAEFFVREIILFESKVIDHRREYPAIYKARLQGQF